MSDVVDLPKQDEDRKKDYVKMVEKTREKGKVMRLTCDGAIFGKIDAYITKMYDTPKQSDFGHDEVYGIWFDGLPKEKIMSKERVASFMLESYEAEIMEVSEVNHYEDPYKRSPRKQIKGIQDRKDPFKHTYIVLGKPSNGRLKDRACLVEDLDSVEEAQEKGEKALEELGKRFDSDIDSWDFEVLTVEKAIDESKKARKDLEAYDLPKDLELNPSKDLEYWVKAYQDKNLEYYVKNIAKGEDE